MVHVVLKVLGVTKAKFGTDWIWARGFLSIFIPSLTSEQPHVTSGSRSITVCIEAQTFPCSQPNTC